MIPVLAHPAHLLVEFTGGERCARWTRARGIIPVTSQKKVAGCGAIVAQVAPAGSGDDPKNCRMS